MVLGVAFASKLKRSPPPVPSEPFIAWAKKHAVALKTAEPGSGFEDLLPFKAIIGRARVVGVGESTHGTREFFQFKHRLFEFLVLEMGFTAFAMESGFGEATKVNDYVLGGSGDALAVVKGMRFWIWDTEEVVALVEWMRQHNLKSTTARKVTFYGFDLQNLTAALQEAVAYLKMVDPQMAREFEPLHAGAADLQATAARDQRKRDEAAASVRRLLQHLEKNRARFAQANGQREWRLAHQKARVALQTISFHEVKEGDQNRVRDLHMAENVRWILNEEGPGGRVMLWAHNGHISHRREAILGRIQIGWMDWNPLGWHLRKALGGDYVALGTSFNQGSFRSKPLKSLHSVGPARPESFDGVLARVGPPMFALDLQIPVDDPGAAKWLDAAHFARSAGTLYLPPEDDDHNRLSIVPRANFDAIVYFDRTTAARANPQVK